MWVGILGFKRSPGYKTAFPILFSHITPLLFTGRATLFRKQLLKFVVKLEVLLFLYQPHITIDDLPEHLSIIMDNRWIE